MAINAVKGSETVVVEVAMASNPVCPVLTLIEPQIDAVPPRSQAEFIGFAAGSYQKTTASKTNHNPWHASITSLKRNYNPYECAIDAFNATYNLGDASITSPERSYNPLKASIAALERNYNPYPSHIRTFDAIYNPADASISFSNLE
jgi:hypothetical protein